MKKIISDHIILIQEWDWEKNDALGFSPYNLSQGSHKKVWWKCKNNHSWDAEIKSRVSGNGCRYCAGQSLTYERTLLFRFPEIAKEWHPAKNGALTPEHVSYGKSLEVYWLCPRCGETYSCLISNRTSKGRKSCPYCCHNPKASSKYNLSIKFPNIAKEWHPTENGEMLPNEVTPHSNKKYKWLCKNGHTYSASVNNRANGDGCPFCSGQLISDSNRLSVIKPELAKQWHPTKNHILASEISFGSNDYAWWLCPICNYEWKAKVNNRSNGRGCPRCAKGTQSSFPEQVIFHYVKNLFPDAINGYKHKNLEIDIYIPSLKVGIEYDGENYHKTHYKYRKDLEKNHLLFSAGISLIRVRESNCTPMIDDKCFVYECKYSNNYQDLNNVIKKLLDCLCVKADIQNNTTINIDSIRNKILAELHTLPYHKSFAAYIEGKKNTKAKWDYAANYPLTPEMVKPMSDKQVVWTCINNANHKWKASIKSISKGYGCDWCAKRHKYTTEEWIEQAMEVHGDRYDYSMANYIDSKKIVDIICPVHGIFSQIPSEHLSGKGCKWCAGQGGFHELNTLAYCHPDLAGEWDYGHEGNKGLTPKEVVVTDNTNTYWWKCNNGKNHSYYAKISYRIKRNSGCAVCHGKQIAYDTSVEFLRPDLTTQWHQDNELKPSNVSIGSEKSILWKCDNPDHKPYKSSVYNRAHLNSGCPECAGNIKTPLVYRKELKEKFPYIELLNDYEKTSVKVSCRCTICGNKWQPFPFNVLRGKGCPKCKGRL